jgi:general secretion pathway protein A
MEFIPTRDPKRRKYLLRLGFSREPFSPQADPHFMYFSEGHKKVLSSIYDSIDLRRGIIVVEGGFGLGKSTLAQYIVDVYMREFPDAFETAYFHSAGYESEYVALRDICKFFKIPTRRGLTPQWRELEYFLVDQFRRGINVVITLDDAQLMDPDALILLHKLYNFEAGTDKLAQVIVFGQPQIKDVFAARKEVRSRVHKWLTLPRLSLGETIELITHRAMVAGRDQPLFTEDGYRILFYATQGVPRNIVSVGYEVVDLLGEHDLDIAEGGITTDAVEFWRARETDEERETN